MAALGGHAARAATGSAPPAAPAEQPTTIKPFDEATARSIAQRSAGIYDVLAGEMYAQRRELGRAYVYLMDGARRSGDTRLYARAAEIAIRAHAVDAALKTIQDWKAIAPDDAEADSYQLQIQMLLGQVAQSESSLAQALAHAKADKRPAMIHAIPVLYSKAKDPLQTLQIAERVLARYSDAPDTAFVTVTTLARMQLAARQYPQAMALLQKSQTAPVPATKLGILLPNRELPPVIALDVMRMGRTSAPAAARQAEALVRSAISHNDASAELQFAYAQVLLETHRPADSLAQLRQLTQRHPGNATAWLLQGAIEGQNKRWDAADAALQQYLKLRATEPQAIEFDEAGDAQKQAARLLQRMTAVSGDIQAYRMLAEIADARNEPAAANQWIKRIQPQSARNTAMLQRAEALSQKGQYDLALQISKDLPTDTAQNRTVKALLESRIEEKAGRSGNALDILHQALGQGKDDPELLYARASVFEKRKQHAEAEQDWRRVIALKPKSSAAYNALGYGLADRNQRLPEARALIATALKLDPDNAAIQDSMGWVEYRLGNLQEAKRLLQQAFAAEPQSEIAAHLGEVLWKLGEQEQARAIWQQGLEIDAKDAVLLQTIEQLSKPR